MKGELKAGGLALVVGLRNQENDNGKAVTLISKHYHGQFVDLPNGTRAIAFSFDRRPMWLCTGNVTSAQGEQGFSMYDTKNLLPIDGDDNQEPDQLAKDKPAELTA